MSVITTIITIILAALGLFFMLTSLFGLSVYPDFFSRLHVQGVGDTLGALLIVLAMMVQTGFTLLSLKIFLVFVLIMLTNPLGTNMMIIAAINKKDYQAYVETEVEAEMKVMNKREMPAVEQAADEKEESEL